MSIRTSLGSWFYPPEIQLGEQFNYGHREVLLAANELDPTALIRARIPHGWGQGISEEESPYIRDKLFRQIPILSWSTRGSQDLRGKGHSKVHTVGSPWAHLLKAAGVNPRNHFAQTLKHTNQKTNSLLFFPSHSIPGGAAFHTTEVDKLAEIANVKQVTICLFWLDYINPLIRKYYEHFGYQITCAGYKGSAGFDTPWAPIGGRVLFLPTLLDLFESHDVVAFDLVSTSFWYAVSMNKNILLSGKSSEVNWHGEKLLKKVSHLNSRILELTNSDLIDFPIMEVIKPARELLETSLHELGWDETSKLKARLIKSSLLKTGNFDEEIAQPVISYLNQRNSTRNK